MASKCKPPLFERLRRRKQIKRAVKNDIERVLHEAEFWANDRTKLPD